MYFLISGRHAIMWYTGFFVVVVFCFCFLTVCRYRYCPVTVPLTMNQTLCAKAFITARHLGDESVASGTGSWAISKWTEWMIRTLTQRQAAVRLPWMPESDRRRAVPWVKLECFKCLSDHQGEVEHFQRHTMFILFFTPVTPVWKELAVSLPAKGRFFFCFFFFVCFLYITPILNKRPVGPRTVKGFKNQNNVAQFSRTKNNKQTKQNKNLHCFKVKLGKPAVYRILPRTVRDWNNVGEFTASAKSWRWWV